MAKRKGLLSTESMDVKVVDGILCCPVCEEDNEGSYGNLHQYGVEAFFRGEDQDHGMHGYISGRDLFMDARGDCGLTSSNPSARLQVMIIYFYCERHSYWDRGKAQTYFVLELNIAQHKGDTLMGWTVKKYAPQTRGGT